MLLSKLKNEKEMFQQQISTVFLCIIVSLVRSQLYKKFNQGHHATFFLSIRLIYYPFKRTFSRKCVHRYNSAEWPAMCGILSRVLAVWWRHCVARIIGRTIYRVPRKSLKQCRPLSCVNQVEKSARCVRVFLDGNF